MNDEDVMEWLTEVTDPEVPVLSIVDLGIVRKISVSDGGHGPEVTIAITPTYSGCPAMDVIAIGIRMCMAGHGVRKVEIINQVSPAWTTDWMSEAGKQKLLDYGIAPPRRKAFDQPGLFENERVPCPRCGSTETELVSRYGATSCKALYKCLACLEPFEHFKCH